MKKILVFGSTGMAGHVITLYLESLQKYEIVNSSSKSKLNNQSILYDISDINNLSDMILEINPDIIINAIGILNDKSDLDIKNTIYINTFFPHLLEQIGIMNDIKIIHLSTDCVFSGTKGEYTEKDTKDEMGIYGLTKNIGEIINSKDLTFRTSIIGPELKTNGKGLFHWLMNQSGKVNGYTNVYWSGITTLELAKAIDKAIENNLVGLYHLVQNKKISKYDLLNIIKDKFELNDTNILPHSKKFSDKSMVNTRDDFDFEIANYEDMMVEMRLWMIRHKEIYGQYLA